MGEKKLARREFLKLGAAAGASVALGSGPYASAKPLRTSKADILVDGASRLQRIDGFGFSEAFQRANILHGSEGLSQEKQREVLDLLFDTEKGAGFSILRNQIGSAPDNTFDHMRSIEPTSPGSPTAKPHYVWDGSDNSQVWLSKEAMRYGVRTIYADAWSAPGYMKTNGSYKDGGYLCGVPGTSCPYDWRQAYANYLVQYLRFYEQEGIEITYVGFLNEPELATSYASMQSNGLQAADFIKILGPTLERSGLGTKIACSDSVGWKEAEKMAQQILSDPEAAEHLSLVTGHGYADGPSFPIESDGRPVWQSEWSTFDSWNTSWDDGSESSGLSWASRISTALSEASVNAFFYWWGAHEKDDNEGLIRLQGNSYSVSKRLWAFAGYSRSVRPGDVRLESHVRNPNLKVTAFRGRGERLSVQAINTSGSDAVVEVEVRHAGVGRWITPYLTNGLNSLSKKKPLAVRRGTFRTTIPARSMVTFVNRERSRER
ncbi:MAG: twin-arginine translocation signal domain-containing protein [Rubrobacteraceae bacterium]|nr:twin-arginine translocation signal domain-containing protein [Rubrobacteraceae bacterium]